MDDAKYYWFSIMEDEMRVTPRDMNVKYSDASRTCWLRSYGQTDNIVNGAYKESTYTVCRSNVMPSWAWNKLAEHIIDRILEG